MGASIAGHGGHEGGMDLLEYLMVAVAGLAALIYLPLAHRAPALGRSVVKTLPLLMLAGLAWVLGLPGVLLAGLILSALGDLALSRDGEPAFLAGLGAFALAHVFYVICFLQVAQSGVPLWAIAVGVGLLALFLSTEWWLAPHTGPLRAPVRAYVVIIAAMGYSALMLPAELRLATLGAGLFILSDLILAIQLFRLTPGTARSIRAGWAVWVFYIAAQAAIVAAFVLLRTLP